MTNGADQDLGNISMAELFRMETAAQTAVLTDGLLALEKNPADSGTLDSLMRAAHSIKGAARIMGLDIAVKIAHALEDRFSAARQGASGITAAQADLLLEGVDFLLNVSKRTDDEIAAGVPAMRSEAERLSARLAGMQSEPPAVKHERAVADTPAPPPALQKTEAAGKSAGGREAQSVRITADHLSRILGMVDESIVQMRWLEPFVRRLAARKNLQSKLGSRLDDLRLMLESDADIATVRRQLDEIIAETRAVLSASAGHISAIEDFSRRIEDLSDRLYREVLASRMRPFSDCAQGFPRMVRDLARRLGKEARLEISGQSVPVDREILDKLEAPLAHLLRNALDHGIETPEARVSAGKPAEGVISLSACHHAGMLHITVADDGAGIDIERIRAKVVERKLSSREVAERMTDQEVLNFLFLPGFSTTAQVTEISGRGVGLDIVLNLSQELGGSVRVENRRPRGSCFQLYLPITLSLLRALIVEIAGAPFVLPLARVEHLVKADLSKTISLEGKRYLHRDGKNIGLISAADVLELKGPGTAPDVRPVVIISDQDNHYGLIVDRLLGESIVVVRRLDQCLGKVQDVSAVTLLDNGTPALILDVEDLLRSVDRKLAQGGLASIAHPGLHTASKVRRRVLVADDSITVRELERKLLQNRGYQVDVSVDGMEAFNSLRARKYDLLVSDVDMPRLNGVELIRRIRQDPRLTSLPVIIVSYKDREEDRLRGLEAGANVYLTKSSFQDDTFTRTVADLIGMAEE